MSLICFGKNLWKLLQLNLAIMLSFRAFELTLCLLLFENRLSPVKSLLQWWISCCLIHPNRLRICLFWWHSSVVSNGLFRSCVQGDVLIVLIQGPAYSYKTEELAFTVDGMVELLAGLATMEIRHGAFVCSTPSPTLISRWICWSCWSSGISWSISLSRATRWLLRNVPAKTSPWTGDGG